MSRTLHLPSILITSLVLLALANSAAAQDEDGVEWNSRATVGANIFFGNTSQTALLAGLDAERASPVLGVNSGFNFIYGEARDPDGATSVNKRTWNARLELDFDPTNPFNLFLSGKVESVFEKRIDLRWNAGGGARYQFLREERNRGSVALAVLGEQTRPRDTTDEEIETVAKWSARLRYQRQMADGRITFSSDTQYEPELDRLDVFTLSSSNSFTFQLTEGLALQLEFVDDYDSAAEERGARTNNDGRIFFAVVTTF